MILKSHSQILLSGVQPTSNLHIGNYFGAIKNIVDNQDKYNCLLFIADLHALTIMQFSNSKDIINTRSNSLYILASYLASGIDPKKTLLFLQSHIKNHCYFMWLLSCMTPMGRLDRMVQMKDKSKQFGKMLGIFSYPVLMAADILLYNPNFVPVGEDQEQHVELTRYLAQTLNNLIGENYFHIPQVINIANMARIKSLKDGKIKMSKSGNEQECIFFTDDENIIKEKIKKAKTDEFLMPKVIDDDFQKTRPEIYNLINIYKGCTEYTNENIINLFADQKISIFKNELSSILIEKFVPIGNKIKELIKNPLYLQDILDNNIEQIEKISDKTLNKIKNLLV